MAKRKPRPGRKAAQAMTFAQAAEALEQHKAWRHGAEIDMQPPRDVDLAMDTAIEALKALAKLQKARKVVRDD